MAGSLEIDVERGKAQGRTQAVRLQKAVNLLLQHRGLMAQHGLVVPPALDKETFTLLHDEAAERELT